VLQEREVVPIGDDRPSGRRPLCARPTATRRAVERGLFRDDCRPDLGFTLELAEPVQARADFGLLSRAARPGRGASYSAVLAARAARPAQHRWPINIRALERRCSPPERWRTTA